MPEGGMKLFFRGVKIIGYGSLILWPLGLWKAIEIILWMI